MHIMLTTLLIRNNLNTCARDILDIFEMLSFIVTFVGSSSKCTNMLKDIQKAKIAKNLVGGDFEIEKGLNQIYSFKRVGMT